MELPSNIRPGRILTKNVIQWNHKISKNVISLALIFRDMHLIFQVVLHNENNRIKDKFPHKLEQKLPKTTKKWIQYTCSKRKNNLQISPQLPTKEKHTLPYSLITLKLHNKIKPNGIDARARHQMKIQEQSR